MQTGETALTCLLETKTEISGWLLVCVRVCTCACVCVCVGAGVKQGIETGRKSLISAALSPGVAKGHFRANSRS